MSIGSVCSHHESLAVVCTGEKGIQPATAKAQPTRRGFCPWCTFESHLTIGGEFDEDLMGLSDHAFSMDLEGFTVGQESSKAQCGGVSASNR